MTLYVNSFVAGAAAAAAVTYSNVIKMIRKIASAIDRNIRDKHLSHSLACQLAFAP